MANDKKWKYLGDMTEDEFMKKARDNYHLALTEDQLDRDIARDDVRFFAGGDGQWDASSLAMRRGDGTKPARPVLSWNRLHEPVYQVVNDGRTNKPSIKVTAMDGGNPKTAEFFQSRIRQVEYDSDADIAYDTGRQQAVVSGRGFIRIRTDYKSPTSFEQQIHIDEIENQFSVLCDPSAVQYDRSDGDFMFIGSRISKGAFERKHGKAALEKFSTFFDSGEITYGTEWVGNDELIPEVEYWYKAYKKDMLYELSSGQSILASKFPSNPELVKALRPALTGRKRETYIPRIVQYIIDGAQILSETLWIGTTIPIVPHWGDYLFVDDKRRTFSLIRHAKDPQRVVNLTVSNIAELTAQVSKTKWAVAEGQLAGHEAEWEANSPHLYKQYKIVDSSGRQLPAPQPDQSEPPIQALTVQLGQAIDATKAGTGIFNAALGDRSNETSGKAINARKMESDLANFHFIDNEARTRKAIGRILLEIIPIIDKGKNEVPIREADGSSKMIPLNKPFTDKDGRKTIINPNEGNYGVAISTGPNYTSQREQAFDQYSEIAKADQNFMGVAGDILFRNMDAPGADEIAERYAQAVIPPELRKAKDGEPVIPPEIQQAMEKAKQNMTALNEYAKQLEVRLRDAELELKSRQMEIESKERIANLQEETKRTVALADLETKTGIELLKQEIASIKHRMEMNQQDKQAVMNLIQKQEEAAAAKPAAEPKQPKAAPAPEQPAEVSPVSEEELDQIIMGGMAQEAQNEGMEPPVGPEGAL